MKFFLYVIDGLFVAPCGNDFLLGAGSSGVGPMWPNLLGWLIEQAFPQVWVTETR